MSWSNKQSSRLTRICIWLFTAAYLMVLAACPFLMKNFVSLSYSAAGIDYRLFILSFYACAVPIGMILFHLNGLINSIANEEIFTAENIRRRLHDLHVPPDPGHKKCFRPGQGAERRKRLHHIRREIFHANYRKS